jgi:serine/threonine-protein kinase SBK
MRLLKMSYTGESIRAVPTSSCSGETKKLLTEPSSLMKEFEILKTLSKGNYSKILLVKKKTEKMVLKAVRCDRISGEDFERELQTNYYLSPHPSILTSYNIFVQEYAPFGDLGRWMKKRAPSGMRDETGIKLIKQIASALDFMHSSTHIVHGNISPENVLIFQEDLSLVKLCDFGSAQAQGSLVVRTHTTSAPSFLCPEVTETLPQEKYYVEPATDVWGLGILAYFCLTGTSPWQRADIRDSAYTGYLEWHKRKSLRMPEPFKAFTPRFLRLLKRLLEPKSSKRCEIKEVFKYLKDEWIKRTSCPVTSSKESLFGRKDSLHSNSGGERLPVLRQRSVSTSPAATARKASSTQHSRAKSLKVVKFASQRRKLSDDEIYEMNFKRSVSYGK